MAFSTSSASSTPARVVYLSAQGNHVNTTGEIAMKLGDPGNEVLIIDASHSATLTNYMFQFNLPKDAAKHSFNQLLADLIESDGCVEKLTLSDYVLPVPNYPTTYIIPSLGDFSLYLSGLYGIMNKPQRYPRAVPFQKQLLTSLDTLLNKFASRFHVYIDTSPTLDIVTQMVIVAARYVMITLVNTNCLL